MEKNCNCLLACSSKCYIAHDYDSKEQIEEYIALLKEHEFLDGDPELLLKWFETVQNAAPNKKLALKGVSNQQNITYLDFLKVLLGVEQCFTISHGIRKQVNSSTVSIYHLTKEAISGINRKRRQLDARFSVPFK